jgi:anti-anti-sigma regulatory factor
MKNNYNLIDLSREILLKQKAMENISEFNYVFNTVVEDSIFESHKLRPESEEKINVKRIQQNGDILTIKNELMLKTEFNELAGVYFHGTQYYDLKNVRFINNTGIANLIDLLKTLLQQNVEVKFVNVCQPVKDKIKSMGLENILNCC